jgi:hypothetical protein
LGPAMASGPDRRIPLRALQYASEPSCTPHIGTHRCGSARRGENRCASLTEIGAGALSGSQLEKRRQHAAHGHADQQHRPVERCQPKQPAFTRHMRHSRRVTRPQKKGTPSWQSLARRCLGPRRASRLESEETHPPTSDTCVTGIHHDGLKLTLRLAPENSENGTNQSQTKGFLCLDVPIGRRPLENLLTRLTNAFSKKLENHALSVALHYMHYNFCRIHKTLRITPAMATGVTDHVWSVADVVSMIEAAEPAAAKRGPYRKRSGE